MSDEPAPPAQEWIPTAEGTPFYLAPEILNHKDQATSLAIKNYGKENFSQDIYSAGLILFIMNHILDQDDPKLIARIFHDLK